jgi:hypothetical protein
MYVYMRVGACRACLEEKLSVQIAHVDRVEVDHLNVALKASQDQVLQELAPNATGAHHQHPRRLSLRKPRHAQRGPHMRPPRLRFRAHHRRGHDFDWSAGRPSGASAA